MQYLFKGMIFPCLLKIALMIDRLNRVMGKISCFAILMVTIISAINAISRYSRLFTSNAMLDLQWYLFGISFLLASGYAYLTNQHIRIDLLSSRISLKKRSVIEIIGLIFFMIPIFSIIFFISCKFAISSWQILEMSANTDGLPPYIIKTFIPIGIFLLLLQAVSQLFKHLLFLNDYQIDQLNLYNQA